jgi:hypothetical protein
MAIAFHIQDDAVVFNRILYAGRSLDTAFPEKGRS